LEIEAALDAKEFKLATRLWALMEDYIDVVRN